MPDHFMLRGRLAGSVPGSAWLEGAGALQSRGGDRGTKDCLALGVSRKKTHEESCTFKTSLFTARHKVAAGINR